MKKLFELEQVKTFWNVIKKKFFRNPKNNATASKGQVLTYIDNVTTAWADFPAMLTFKGIVDTYDDLTNIENPSIGDVYSVKGTVESSNIEYFWDGTAWEYMGSMISGEGFVKKTGDEMSGNLSVVIDSETAVLSAKSLSNSNSTASSSIGVEGITIKDATNELSIKNAAPYSFAFGEEATAAGLHSVAIGYKVKSEGELCYIEGNESSIEANASVCHVEGDLNKITGESWATHVEGGENTNNSAHWAHVEGHNNTNSGTQSHVEGRDNTVSGRWSHTEGSSNTNTGDCAHAEGQGNTVSGKGAHAESYQGTISGDFAHGEGFEPEATGQYAHAEGGYSMAYGKYSHVEGCGSMANNTQAHAEGYRTQATGLSSHAEGNYTQATYNYAHAEGDNTTASGLASHAEGQGTKASGDGSHAEGSGATASGDYAHAEGNNTIASGTASHASGVGTTAAGNYQTAIGKYNTADSNNKYALIIGKGTADDSRSNALVVDWSGNVAAAGDVNASAFYETSDERKKNVKENLDISRCYDFLEKCSPIIFEWKEDKEHKDQLGLIAQEVQSFFPEIVYTGEDGYLSLDYAKLTVICLQILKDLTDKVNKYGV